MSRNHLLFLFGFFILGTSCLSADPASGQQQVVLYSGSQFVGEVALANEQVTITINGAKITIPFREVASIVPAGPDAIRPAQPGELSTIPGPASRAQEFLRQSLESQLLDNRSQSRATDPVLLRQAYEIEPRNPAVAYWYARALVESGSGKTAHQVLESHRTAIAAAYPAYVDRLAKRIQQRITIEKLPWQLVDRIDALTTGGVARMGDSNDRVPTFAVFRILDQDGQALKQADFRIRSNGRDEKTEAFDEGYFLHSYLKYRNSNSSPSTVEISALEYQPRTFELKEFNNQQAAVVSEQKVRRMPDSEKLTLRATVVDDDGKPIVGASLRLQPQTSSRSSSNYPTAKTGADGSASLEAFPGPYTLFANATGYLYSRKSVALEAGNNANKLKLVMPKAIRAKIQVDWKSAGLAPESQETSGQTTIVLNSSSRTQAADQRAPWVRLYQKENQIYLAIQHYPYGGYGPSEIGTWIREFGVDRKPDASPESDSTSKATGAKFVELDLDDVPALKGKLPEPKIDAANPQYRQQGFTFPVEIGDRFVGQCTVRSPRDGRPESVTFKIRVESDSK